MGKEIVFDYSKTAGFISEEEMKNMKSTVMGAEDVLTAKSGAGNDYLGWIDLPVDYDKEEFAKDQESGRKDSGRFRCASRDRYRRILPRSPRCDRVFIPQLLQCAAEGKEKTP